MFKFNKYKWYKVLDKKYMKNKIKQPYDSLFEYYSLVADVPYIKKSACKGHFYAIYLSESIGELEKYKADLQAVLPEYLYDNFCDAEQLYKQLMEGVDYNTLELDEEIKLIKAFKVYDDYANTNYKAMEDILKKCDEEVEKLANK